MYVLLYMPLKIWSLHEMSLLFILLAYNLCQSFPPFLACFSMAR